jgi:putative solute:sodium symporter small subunit
VAIVIPALAESNLTPTCAEVPCSAAAWRDVEQPVGRGGFARLFTKGGTNAMARPDRVSYWNKTRNLMFVMLALWFFFGYFVHFFVESLNNIVILGFPLGYYMAAQGSLIAFVVMLFWFARKQNSIDEEHGVSED